MNLFKKIGIAVVGMAMAVGVGVAVGNGNQTIDVNAEVEANPTASLGTDCTHSNSGIPTTGTSGWKTSVAPGSYESASYARGWQYGNGADPVITYFSSGTTFGKVTVTASSNASSGNVTLSCSVGGTTWTPASTTVAVGTGNANSTYDFTGSNSGNVVVTVTNSNASKTTWIKDVQIFAESSAVLTGLRIASGTPNKLYKPGESFDGTGLTVYASWDSEEDTSKNVLSSVVWNGGVALTAGKNQTITGYHANDENEDYPIQVTGVDVVNPDATLSGTLKPAGVGSDTSTTATGEGQVNSSGVKYGYYALATYSSNLEFNKAVSGAYVGNNESYGYYIRRVIVTLSADNFSKLTMYEGVSAIPGSTSVTPSGSGTKRVYDFSGGIEYFALKQTTTNTWIQIVSIEVFLGDEVEESVVTTVEIATPGSVYVGKKLQLSATVHYSNKADDHRVTWSVASGDGATVNDGGLVTAVSTTATTIRATSVDKNDSSQYVSASVVITPVANPIVSVAWDTTNAKKQYNIGDPLDIEGVVATGTNAAGDDDVEIELTESNFSGFDSSAAITGQTITVTYLSFFTTYTIDVVAAPNCELIPSDFKSGGYTVNDEDGVDSNVGNIHFAVKDAYLNSSKIQVKASSGLFYNADPLGSHIEKVEISIANSDCYLRFGTSPLTSTTASQSVTLSSSTGVTTVIPNSNTYQYLRIDNNGTWTGIVYLKVWFAPFVPTVTLSGESSYAIDEGDAGDISITATATHFTNNSGVVFTASSGNVNVLTNENISVVGSTITISKANVNPGSVTVTITGTYSAASEVATATFTITCTAAARNLESIAITTASSDIEFEAGSKFTISGLVVTGTFDAAPLTEDVTASCTFKLWNGASETALTPGTTTLSSTGNYTVRITLSPAAEVLTYDISVVSSETLTLTPNINGATFNYGDTKTPSIEISLNVNLDSNFRIETYGLSRQNDNMQMNPSKGSYIKNTTAVPGKIIRIEMDWTGNTPTTNATPTVYFSSSYIASKPISGGTKATADTSNSVSAVGNNYYFFLDGTTIGAWTQLTELRIIYIENDTGAAQNFADEFLLMNTYDQGGVHGSTAGDGTCLTLYGTAKTAYGNLTEGQKNEFAKLSAPVARFQDWAARNTETFNANTGTFTSNSRAIISEKADEKNASTILVIVTSLISVVAVGGYFFYRTRKEQ